MRRMYKKQKFSGGGFYRQPYYNTPFVGEELAYDSNTEEYFIEPNDDEAMPIQIQDWKGDIQPVRNFIQFLLDEKKSARATLHPPFDKHTLLTELGASRLSPHQTQAIQLALTKHDIRVNLSLDMGGFKTFTSIALAKYVREHYGGQILFTVDKNKIKDFMEEAKKYAGIDLTWVKSKKKEPKEYTDPYYIVSHYLGKDLDKMMTGHPWKMIIVDEAQILRGENSEISLKWVNAIQKARYALLLSGTPMLGSPMTLHKLLYALQPGIFEDRRAYSIRYAGGHLDPNDGKSWIEKQCLHQNELHVILSKFMIRMTEEDIKRINSSFGAVAVTSTKEAAALVWKSTEQEEEEKEEKNFDDYEEWDVIIKKLLPGDTLPSKDVVYPCKNPTKHMKDQAVGEAARKLCIWKIKYVQQFILDDIRSLPTGQSGVVFFEKLAPMKLFCKFLKDNNQEYEFIDGSVPDNQRDQIVKKLASGIARIGVFTYKTCGVGINLIPFCVRMYHPDLTFDKSNIVQANKRIKRHGRRFKLIIYRFICPGTFDDQMVGYLKKHIGWSNNVVDGGRVDASSIITHTKILD